jgi:hypothetical protein
MGQDAARFLQAHGTPELHELLKGPIGSHPALVQLFAGLGAALKVQTDPLLTGQPAAQQEPDLDARVISLFGP